MEDYVGKNFLQIFFQNFWGVVHKQRRMLHSSSASSWTEQPSSISVKAVVVSLLNFATLSTRLEKSR